MLRKNAISTLVAFAMIAAPALASVRIDFSDSSNNRQGGSPGFRVSNGDGGGISERLEIGNNADGDNLSFLRITGSTSSTQGVDVLDFIVAFPNLQLANTLGADGNGIDNYDLQFQGGGVDRAAAFGIYGVGDTGLTTPFLLADMHLVDRIFRTLGSSGAVETSVTPLAGLVNLDNIVLLNGGAGFPTLLEFALQSARGADFVANVSSAGTRLSQRILGGNTVEGSASGSIFVPEPGTVLLLVAGAMMAVRARRVAR